MKTLSTLTALFCFANILHAAAPKSPDPRIVVELVSEAPDIVTPTGLGVDGQGRVIVIESHTHFRPKDYDGPERDRVLMFTMNENGKAKRSIFFEGLNMGMDVAVGHDGWVYLAERSRILRVKDTTGNGRANKTEDVIVMKTTGTYPHNGLSGLCFDGEGNLVFGLGENLGHPYTMTGRDGRKIEGAKGIGGGVFRCTAEGNKLEQIARGFWNPFGVCVDNWGRIFAVDNDPGNSPPCRLLHVVQDGDYGYRYKYGRRGIHPFLAWDGELIGTLPMVHGTGEGPCEIIQFDSSIFPGEYRGRLLVTSWGDHRVEMYSLKRKGASVAANMSPLVQGDDSFRPVGLAMAPNGHLYLSDWGSSSYNLNKKGRLWRIRPVKDFKAKPLVEPLHVAHDRQRLRTLAESKISKPDDLDALINTAATNTDPFMRHAALKGLSRGLAGADFNLLEAASLTARQKAALFFANRSKYGPILKGRLSPDSEPREVLFEYARWIADTKQLTAREEIEAHLHRGPAGYSLFRAYLACLDELDSRANPDRFNEKYALPLLQKKDTNDALRANLLRYFPSKHRVIDSRKLVAWLNTGNMALRREAIWKMRAHYDEHSHMALRQLALNPKEPLPLRAAATAVMGTSTSPDTDTLMEIAQLKEPSLRTEAMRSLIGAHHEVNTERKLAAYNTPLANRALGKPFQKNPPDTKNTAAWLKRLDSLPGKASPAAGERIFHHTKIATCGKCHQVNERGIRVGPDLTHIGRGMSRERLLESILQPNKEISPYLRTWVITMDDGKVHSGIAMRRGGNAEVYLGIDGRETRLDKRRIKSKIESNHSLMPTGLALTLTPGELRDLLAFLLTDR
ncbi:MAG: hypothetical protein CMO74_15290 [Verrucomicrobiales bacterium]|nr:hypothetical protein [Verrucomicrobiales bacterium]|tara:strand:- start:9063 stop:11606 length:2544 start_codon:yes stop_codon:yes gene_type:complete